MDVQLVEPGKLRWRFSLQKLKENSGLKKNWIHVDFVFGSMILDNIHQSFSIDKMSQMVKYDIILRYREDIRLNMRLSRNNKHFKIIGFADLDQSRRYLTCLTCEENNP